MPSWQEEYYLALVERDRREKANKELYDTYTKLADRSAELHAPTLSIREPRNKPNALSTERVQDLDQARQDLAEAQRSKATLQIRLQETNQKFERLRLQSRNDGKQISDLAIEKASISKKLKDREEEIRGKAKLLEDVHDDNLSLSIQLNLAEERSTNLQAENRQLVDRWMARMGQEAEAMNEASKFS